MGTGPRVAKRVLEGLLAGRTAGWIGRHRLRGRRLVLAYHNVVPPGPPSGDASLHLPFDQFRRQLDALQHMVEVVPLGQGPTPGEPPRVAISFDDAYAGAVAAALPELARRGLPCTVFVAPGLLGAAATWWDLLADAPAGLSDERRHDCLERLAGVAERILGGSPPPRPRGPELAIATIERLRSAVNPLVSLGAHSWSHPNLTRLPAAEVGEELTRSLRWLRQAFPDHARPWVAWPYGLSDAAVRRIAAEAGYEAGYAVSGGWRREADPMAQPRLNIPAGLSLDGFRLRLNGFLSG